MTTSFKDNGNIGLEETKVLLKRAAKHGTLFSVICEEGEGERERKKEREREREREREVTGRARDELGIVDE